LKQFFRAALRIALSSYVANGLVAAAGVLLISGLVHLALGAAAAAATTVGVIVVTPPDRPAPLRGKFTHFLPAVLIGTPLFCATGLLRGSPLGLALLLVGASFVAFLGAAWGKRGLPISVSVMFAMVFALALPPSGGTDALLQQTLAFGIGGSLYALWGTLANALLNARYRVLTVVDSLFAVSELMRAEGLHFTLPPDVQRRTALAGRLMKQQADLADQLQAARNILLENPRRRAGCSSRHADAGARHARPPGRLRARPGGAARRARTPAAAAARASNCTRSPATWNGSPTR